MKKSTKYLVLSWVVGSLGFVFGNSDLYMLTIILIACAGIIEEIEKRD